MHHEGRTLVVRRLRCLFTDKLLQVPGVGQKLATFRIGTQVITHVDTHAV